MQRWVLFRIRGLDFRCKPLDGGLKVQTHPLFGRLRIFAADGVNDGQVFPDGLPWGAHQTFGGDHLIGETDDVVSLQDALKELL